jgi:large subunit ribosomal protein L13
MERKTYTIDAANKPLGRLAVEVSLLLRGKGNPAYRFNIDAGGIVIVKNVSKIDIGEYNLREKKYYSHSHFAKGFKEVPVGKVFERDPGEVLRRAVWGMLPGNRLRPQQIKRLKFE